MPPTPLPSHRHRRAGGAAPLSPPAAFGNGAKREYEAACRMRKPSEFAVAMAVVATLALAAVLTAGAALFRCRRPALRLDAAQRCGRGAPNGAGQGTAQEEGGCSGKESPAWWTCSWRAPPTRSWSD